MYALLETASTDCDSASVQLVPEVNKRDQRGAVRASEEGRRSSERVNGGGKKQTEKSGAAASAVGGSEKTHFTTSLPMEVERHIGRPTSAEGVSSHTVATDVSKRMDSKQTSATVSDCFYFYFTYGTPLELYYSPMTNWSGVLMAEQYLQSIIMALSKLWCCRNANGPDRPPIALCAC